MFLDGVGIGPADPAVNPFFRARLPVLRDLLGGELPHLGRPRVDGPSAVALPLDATLDVPGLPQSGTGQATLLTGENAALLHGAHFGPWVPVRLRPLVEERNVMVRAAAAGHRVAFANAYPRGWPRSGRGGRRTVVAGLPLAARAAGLMDRDHSRLARGDAVSSEIVNDGWRRILGHGDVPAVTAAEAGANLARIAREHALTVYAHYATDTAGHRGESDRSVDALERVDAFLGGLLPELPGDATVWITSDHGNIEDVNAGHTRNPALCVVAGEEAAARTRGLASLADVTPRLLEGLGTP